MNFTLEQLRAASEAIMVNNEWFDGEPVDPVWFLGQVIEGLKKQAQAAPQAQVPQAPALETDLQKGDIVRIIGGKGIAHGTEAKVFWLGVKVYNGKEVLRIGMRDRDGKTLWTSANNVEVIPQIKAAASELDKLWG